MTTTTLSPVFRQQFFDNNGNPLFNGKLYAYQAGTTTPQATYTDSTGLQANTNPITLDYRGECNCWIPPNVAYKFVLTDSSGTTIWTINNVTNAQLITLWGGTDTGSANAYVLNFTANFTTLTDGIIVYWWASNTNTGASTLNVNNLGVIPILNQQTGAALGPGQIVANGITATIYKGGNWYLTSSSGSTTVTGSFTGTFTGGTGGAVTINYQVTSDGIVWLTIQPFSQVSSAATFTITGLPTILLPSSRRQISCYEGQDNSATIINSIAALLDPAVPGVITLQKLASASGWTNTGVKALGHVQAFAGIPTVISYPLKP